MNDREQTFAETFFNGKPFEQPSFFPLSHPEMQRYTPDFYDVERDVYIEVVGTRQAYQQNKGKYKVFRKEYPHIKFELRHHTGEIYHPRQQTIRKNTNKWQAYIIFLKEKLGTWKRVSEVLDITPRYCYMILRTGKVGKHLERIIRQKVELYR